MKTPDLTPAQIVAALSALATSLVVLFKLNLTAEQQAAIAGLIGTVVPAAWVIADSIIRHGRSVSVASANALATAQLQNLPADGDDSQVEPPPAK